MVQIISNAALIEGTVTIIENYEPQQGFQLITVLINKTAEKEGTKFLGDGILNTEIKVLVREALQKKLQLQSKMYVSGEIKKVSQLLWRGNEATWKIKSTSKTEKKPKK